MLLMCIKEECNTILNDMYLMGERAIRCDRGLERIHGANTMMTCECAHSYTCIHK